MWMHGNHPEAPQVFQGDVLATEILSGVRRCAFLYGSSWRITKLKRVKIFILLENESFFKSKNFSCLENYISTKDFEKLNRFYKYFSIFGKYYFNFVIFSI